MVAKTALSFSKQDFLMQYDLDMLFVRFAHAHSSLVRFLITATLNTERHV